VPEEEATRLYELFIKESNKIKTSCWCIPGNHEIFGIERHLSLVSKSILYMAENVPPLFGA
jgi:hypothetical protein